METLLKTDCFFVVGIAAICIVSGHPIGDGGTNANEPPVNNRLFGKVEDVWNLVATGAAVLSLLSVVYILGCACCRFRPRFLGFKKFRDDNVLVANEHRDVETRIDSADGHPGEVRLVPAELEAVVAKSIPAAADLVAVEGRSADSFLPAALASWSVAGSEKDWFDDPHENFPRNQLKYVRLLGKGWFGQTILSEAWGRVPSSERQQRRAVVVKSLTEGASPAEQMCFLHEVRACRDVNHPNVLKLVGRCLEADPFLVILEYCPMGDLKSYLRSQRGSPGEEGLRRDGVLLRMAQEIAAALSAMHHQGIVHLDLSVRNCMLSDDLRVKVGDYGDSLQKYPEDYLLTENGAVPIRWVAPECVRPALSSSVRVRDVTAEANVWTYGVVVWEVLEMGARPYGELVSDGDVVSRVIVQRNYRLRLPTGACPFKDRIYQIMHMCWQEEQFRPAMATIANLMTHLLQACNTSADDLGADFEVRWHALQQSKPAVMNLDPSYDLHPSLCFESDFNFVAMREQVIGRSPSLQKLKGSLDDLEEEEDVVTAAAGAAAAVSPRRQHGAVSGAADFVLGPQPPRRPSPVHERESKQEFSRWLDGRSSVMNVNFKIGKDDDSIVSRVPFGPPSVMAAASAAPESSLRNLSPQISQNDTDTDDDVGWKVKVENEYLTKKVREKSKSVQDLMKLTHLESSPDPDSSDPDSPPAAKAGSNLNSLTNFCASESNIFDTVVEQAFLDSLEKLQAERQLLSASFCKVDDDEDERDQVVESALTFAEIESRDKQRKKENCLPLMSSTPDARYPLETISADLAKFRPEVYDSDASDVILGPCDDLGLDFFQALKSSPSIACSVGGVNNNKTSTTSIAARRSLFGNAANQQSTSTSTSEYGSCHDPDSGKEMTPDAPEVMFWGAVPGKPYGADCGGGGGGRDRDDGNNCASSVSSQDSGVGDKLKPLEAARPGATHSMDSVLDLFADLEEAASVGAAESAGPADVPLDDMSPIPSPVEKGGEGAFSFPWPETSSGNVAGGPVRNGVQHARQRVCFEADGTSADVSKFSDGSGMFVTAHEDFSGSSAVNDSCGSYVTLVGVDDVTLTPGRVGEKSSDGDGGGGLNATSFEVRTAELLDNSLSPIDSAPSSFGPLDYYKGPEEADSEEFRTPASTRSDPCGYDDDDVGCMTKRRASEPADFGLVKRDSLGGDGGFGAGEEGEEEADDRDRENAAESLRNLREMLCMHLGVDSRTGSTAEDAVAGKSEDPERGREEEEEEEEEENVVVNACTASGSLSSSLPLVLSPIRELSEAEESEEEVSDSDSESDSEVSSEDEVEREGACALPLPNFRIPTVHDGSIIFEDLDSPHRFDSICTLENQFETSKGMRGGEDDDYDDDYSDRDDILVVDTETNQAFLCDGGKPRSHLAFVNERRHGGGDEEEERILTAAGPELEAFVCQGDDEEDAESLPVFRIGGKVGDARMLGGRRTGDATRSMPPPARDGPLSSSSSAAAAASAYPIESGTAMGPLSLPWAGEGPESAYRYGADPWTLEKAVESVSSLRNVAAAAAGRSRDDDNDDGGSSTAFSSPRDLPLPDCSDSKCGDGDGDGDGGREDGTAASTSSVAFASERMSSEIEPEWSQLVEEAAKSSDQDNFRLLADLGSGLSVEDMPCLTYNDAEVDCGENIEDLREVSSHLAQGAEADSRVAMGEADGVRYTPDFESESTESSEEESEEDDGSSTTSGEYVYSRSPPAQNPLNKTISDVGTPEPDSGHEAAVSGMAGRLMALKRRHSPTRPGGGESSGDEGEGEDGVDEDGQSPSESGEYPFQPSIWNRELAPSRSSLKTPDCKPPTPDARKSVTFKKLKCSKIYEYPGAPQPDIHRQRNAYRGFAISDDFADKMWSLRSESAAVNVAEWDAADDDDIPEELTTGPHAWPSTSVFAVDDDDEVYPTPSRLSAMNYYSFPPERTQGDGGFSGSEFFPGKFTAVEFFDDASDSPRDVPSKSEPCPNGDFAAAATAAELDKNGNDVRASAPSSSSPESPDLHSMWRREGRLPDRSGLRLDFRPAPLGAESSEAAVSEGPAALNGNLEKDGVAVAVAETTTTGDSGVCDTLKLTSRGEALVLD